MELVIQYLKESRTYQVTHVVRLWNEGKVQATPEIAGFIEKECGITRHDFKEKTVNVIRSDDDDVDNNIIAEAMLAFIIFCIDNQEFDAVAEALEGNPLQ